MYSAYVTRFDDLKSDINKNLDYDDWRDFNIKFYMNKTFIDSLTIGSNR